MDALAAAVVRRRLTTDALAVARTAFRVHEIKLMALQVQAWDHCMAIQIESQTIKDSLSGLDKALWVFFKHHAGRRRENDAYELLAIFRDHLPITAGTRFAPSAEILNQTSCEEQVWAVFDDMQDYMISEHSRADDLASDALFESRSLKRRKVEVGKQSLLLRSTCQALRLPVP